MSSWLVTFLPSVPSEHLRAEIILAPTSRPLTLLVCRRPDAAYGLDGGRDIPLVLRFAMQAPNVGEFKARPSRSFFIWDTSTDERKVRFSFENWKDAAT